MKRKRKQRSVHGRVLACHKSQCRQLVRALGKLGFGTLEVAYDNIYGCEPIVHLTNATTTGGHKTTQEMLDTAENLLWKHRFAIEARLMSHLSGTRADGAGVVGSLEIDTSAPPTIWAHVDAVECLQAFRDAEAVPVL